MFYLASYLPPLTADPFFKSRFFITRFFYKHMELLALTCMVKFLPILNLDMLIVVMLIKKLGV